MQDQCVRYRQLMPPGSRSMQMMIVWVFTLASIFALTAQPLFAQDGGPTGTLSPPTNVKVTDVPNDAGESLNISWDLSPDDVTDEGPPRVMSYEIQRRFKSDFEDSTWTEWKIAGEKTYGATGYVDPNCDDRDLIYEYRVAAVGPGGDSSAFAVGDQGMHPVMQLFDRRKAWFGIILFIIGGSVIAFIEMAKSGRELKVRRIAGLEAVEEAVGRATELGRSCLFVPGIQDINDIQTVAGITVLSSVAKLAAEYGASLDVPTSRSLVMTTARETVHAAFLAAGRPDAYQEDRINYVTDEQFGYVAGVTGKMVREKPAACFYMGAFYAESLILAETGNSIGAIQIAGTAMPSQLPFFVAACDYTLIGEEFFAASAYLSGEAHQLGSLKGQDVGKLLGLIAIAIGCLAASIAVMTATVAPDGSGLQAGALQGFVNFMTDNVLGSGGFLP